MAAAPVKVADKLPDPLCPLVTLFNVPVTLVTVQLYVDASDEVNTSEGVAPLQTVAVELDVITGRELTTTLILAGVPTHPDVLVSVTEI